MLTQESTTRAGTGAPKAHVAAANDSLADKIISMMKETIREHAFAVLDLYPDDIEIDRMVLRRCAAEGAMIAWVVGHSHTHLTMLGLEPEQNEMITCFTNLSSTDRFYLIRVVKGIVSFDEKSRDEFRNLAGTPIPYTRQGGNAEFIIRKLDTRLARCSITRAGSYEAPYYTVTITPLETLRALDRAAVELWCNRAVNLAASEGLFVTRTFVWMDSADAP